MQLSNSFDLPSCLIFARNFHWWCFTKYLKSHEDTNKHSGTFRMNTPQNVIKITGEAVQSKHFVVCYCNLRFIQVDNKFLQPCLAEAAANTIWRCGRIFRARQLRSDFYGRCLKYSQAASDTHSLTIAKHRH